MLSGAQHDITVAAAKIAPPVAVSTAATVGGLSLQDWLFIITIIYTVAQLGLLVYDRCKKDDEE